MSALLPTLPGVSRIRLRSASTGLLRQPREKVFHLPRFLAPHGANKITDTPHHPDRLLVGARLADDLDVRGIDDPHPVGDPA
ncbi:hypothetical protein GCM10027360_20480 [Amycolatopsis echigonensis]